MLLKSILPVDSFYPQILPAIKIANIPKTNKHIADSTQKQKMFKSLFIVYTK